MSSISLPLGFHRLNPFPLETNTQFATLVEAEAYALGPTAVVGQVIAVIDVNPSVAIKYYFIDRDKSLILFGGSGDGAGDATELLMGGTFTVSNPIGNLTNGTTVAATDDLFGLLKKMLNPVVPPEYTAPTLSLAGTTPLAVEFGSNITPTLTPTWNQNDGGTITGYQLFKDATSMYSSTTATAQADSTFSITAATTYHATADFGAGAVKNDSEGHPDPTGQIAADTVTSNNVVYTPQRRSFFGRITSNTIPTASAWLAAADSTVIRALSGGALNPANNTVMTITMEPGDYGCVFAYPDALREVTSVIPASFPLNMVGAFTMDVISVEGANGSTAIPYKVYVMLNAAPFGSGGDTYVVTI